MSITTCRHGFTVNNPYHDCEYVDLRTSLVTEAEKYANENAGPRPPAKHTGSGRAAQNTAYDAWAKVWNLFFHGYIERVVRERYRTQP